MAASMPAALMEKLASPSGRQGEQITLQMRDSPRPLRRKRRVVEAWAMMFPPMGLGWLLPKLLSGLATTWLVITTATPNSSASLCSARRNLHRCIWRALSSPRPSNSLRYSAVAESTMTTAKRESAIMPAAAVSSSSWWSVLLARAQATLSSTSLPLMLKLGEAAVSATSLHRGFLPHRSAMAVRRSGRNVPSVSMYSALPSPPPLERGSCRGAGVSVCAQALREAGAPSAARLAGHGQHVAQLRLAGAKLAVNLGDGARLQAAWAASGGVPVKRAPRQLFRPLAPCRSVSRSAQPVVM